MNCMNTWTIKVVFSSKQQKTVCSNRLDTGYHLFNSFCKQALNSASVPQHRGPFAWMTGYRDFSNGQHWFSPVNMLLFL